MKMNDNLVSIKRMEEQIKSMKLFSFFLKQEEKERYIELENQLENMIIQSKLFTERFSSLGWCSYDSMSFELMERVNTIFDEKGVEEAEQALISYYKTDVRHIIHWIKNSSNAFLIRDSLIQNFFEDHFAERYHASVPLGLIIVDGAVNDFTRSKGFFAEGTAVDAWDCLVGCDENLTRIKEIFNQNRTKTNDEIITLPYRNGIMHGRDLNYANEFVSCKCVALMFAVADWMRMKGNEEERKAIHEKSSESCSQLDSIEQLKENKKIHDEISLWKKQIINVGEDIPINGLPEEYVGYPYLVEVVKMLYAWKNRNYGELSIYLQKLFSSSESLGKRAGECRRLFETKYFENFEIVNVEERACALSKVEVKVYWSVNDCRKEAVLTFGCFYENKTNNIAVPWRNNGEWVLIPWDVTGLIL